MKFHAIHFISWQELFLTSCLQFHFQAWNALYAVFISHFCLNFVPSLEKKKDSRI